MVRAPEGEICKSFWCCYCLIISLAPAGCFCSCATRNQSLSLADSGGKTSLLTHLGEAAGFPLQLREGAAGRGWDRSEGKRRRDNISNHPNKIRQNSPARPLSQTEEGQSHPSARLPPAKPRPAVPVRDPTPLLIL